MDLKEYQEKAFTYADYTSTYYPILGLSEEVGEIASHFSRLARGDYRAFPPEVLTALRKELGDALWDLAAIASEQGWNLSAIAEENITKLADRKARGVIKGSGGDR